MDQQRKRFRAARRYAHLDERFGEGKLHEVIDKRAGISALQQIFAFGDPERLRGLVQGGGFRDVRIEWSSMTSGPMREVTEGDEVVLTFTAHIVRAQR